jgi:ParB family chromosome partitioning protein
VPAVIRSGDESENVKLELAIVENLQREDLNPIDRALAFNQLVKDFGYKHGHVAKKVARSREYVSNSIRLLQLPEDMMQALSERRISEGHARPLLMLVDKPEEQNVLFREIMQKKMTVRDAEAISRRIATDRVRKDKAIDPRVLELEREASEHLGTRVRIAPKEDGGKITIDFASAEDLNNIISKLRHEAQNMDHETRNMEHETSEGLSTEKKKASDDDDTDDLYSISNFSV